MLRHANAYANVVPNSCWVEEKPSGRLCSNAKCRAVSRWTLDLGGLHNSIIIIRWHGDSLRQY